MAADTRWRTLHLFVSSTFNDMHAERDRLRHVVFPELERRLRARRVHLQVVDLRWGVDTLSLDDDAEREREVLRYCLDEVERCRPFMLVLIGDRYGYVPDPDQLPAVARQLNTDATRLEGKSVTELEIEAGLFTDARGPWRHRVFARQALDRCGLPAERLSAMSDVAAGRHAAAEALAGLKRRLLALAPERCADYRLQWDARREAFVGLEPFGDAVCEALWADADAATADQVDATATSPSRLSKHQAETADLIEQRRLRFVGRTETLSRLERFCLSDAPPSALLLAAPSGKGKTSLIAALTDRLTKQGAGGPIVLAHFFGNNTESADIDLLLEVFCNRLADACGLTQLAEGSADHTQLQEAFGHRLARAGESRRVVLLLDALDRLEPDPEARGMRWLPLSWPANVRVIASATDGVAASAFAARMAVHATPLAALKRDEARDLVLHMSALEHRKPGDAVVAAMLGVAGPDGEPASADPLWLTVAMGQLNRIEGADFFVTRARLERRADEQLAGYLSDWVARLPGNTRELLAGVLSTAEGYFGADARHLAWALALARHGWRESDLLGILSRFTQREWSTLGLLKLRHALHGALLETHGGMWEFAHQSLARAVDEDARRSGQVVNLQAAIAHHLAALAPDDPVRQQELPHHALRAGMPNEAAQALARAREEDDDATVVDNLVAELRDLHRGGDAPADWPKQVLWAQSLRAGESLRLADRLQAAARQLAREHRWTACQAALAPLAEFFASNAGRLLERREAGFRQAQVAAELGMCARALGDPQSAAKQFSESGRLVSALIAGTGQTSHVEFLAAMQRAGTQEASMFHRNPTLDRMAQWCDLHVQNACAIAEALMESGQEGSGSMFLLGNAMGLEHDYPAALRAALAQHQPLRETASIALTYAHFGQVWLCLGSGNGAYAQMQVAHGKLATILSFVPRSVALRRELAVVELRMAQAVRLARAPAESVRLAALAVRRLHELCREQPEARAHRIDRAHALRCLADGWNEMANSSRAAQAGALAAADMRSAIADDDGNESAQRSLLWAKQQPVSDVDIAGLLAAPLPDSDYRGPLRPSSGDPGIMVWTSSDSEDEMKAHDAEALARLRRTVLDGPRLGNAFPAIRLGHFAVRCAIEQHGIDALTEPSFSITTPDGVEHAVRGLRKGIAEALHIDGEALLASLRQEAESGAVAAQARLGTLLLNGVFGPEYEREGLRRLHVAARAGSHDAAADLADYLLSLPDDPEAWQQGVGHMLAAAEAGDAQAQIALAYVYLHGRGAARDPARAMEYLRAAAEQGHPAATYDLGVHLESGAVLEADPDAARMWYERAVELGVVSAMTNLGMMLLRAQEETDRAIALLDKASAQGETAAMVALAGYLVHTDPSPEQLMRARALFESAYRAGRAEAGLGLGYLMASGFGGEPDLDAGLQLMKQAAAGGDPRATSMLQIVQAASQSWPVPPQLLDHLRTLGWTGVEVDALLRIATAVREQQARKGAEPVDPGDPQALFERGVYLAQQAKPPDFKSAFECYRRAADLGHPEATYNLAYLYLTGEGVEHDAQAGLTLLRTAAGIGNPQMQYELGVLLSEGTRMAPDRDEAVRWYRRAADQNYPPALHNLAWCYLQGTGVVRDKGAALDLFRRAAAGGLHPSALMVKKLESEP